jgi:hypothetical protein
LFMDNRIKVKNDLLLVLDLILDEVRSHLLDIDPEWDNACKAVGNDPAKVRGISFSLVEEKSFPLSFEQQRNVLLELQERHAIGINSVPDVQSEYWSKLLCFEIAVFTDRAHNLYQELCQELNITSADSLTVQPKDSLSRKLDSTVAGPIKGKREPRIADLVTRDTKWEDITVRFINEKDVVITVNGKSLHTDYKEMGFANRKLKQRPSNIQWMLLCIVSNYEQGKFDWKGKYATKTVRRQKSRLSHTLRDYFNIPSDPFRPYNEEKGYYQIKIKLFPSPTSAYADASEPSNKRRTYKDDYEPKRKKSTEPDLDNPDVIIKKWQRNEDT